MIASQKIGKGFMGAFHYNMKKLNHPNPQRRAELLDTNFGSVDSKMVRREVQLIRQLRPSLGNYVYHTSLNFTYEDNLENDQLKEIAAQYLEKMGFTNNQYFVFRHYDADHPHIHLLANRISFDGTVVSDSNNYKRSETILRRIEEQYNLVSVEPSHLVSERAAKKDELEMVLRTGKPSQKMLLQEKMKSLLKPRNLSLPELIKKGEHQGIHFLFNQASTGRISGITYFHEGFKIKGQALGNSFKWAEIIKKIDYDQDRDSKAVSTANSRTKAIYGELSWSATGDGNTHGRSDGKRGDEPIQRHPAHSQFDLGGTTAANQDGTADEWVQDRSFETDEDVYYPDVYTPYPEYDNDYGSPGIEIMDDIDDEAINGRNRRRKQQARTNTR